MSKKNKTRKKNMIDEFIDGGVKELKHQDHRIEKGCHKHKLDFR
jgi:hypothetical protein